MLLVEGTDASFLYDLTRLERSETARRNSNLFAPGIRHEADVVPYAEHLIHRTLLGDTFHFQAQNWNRYYDPNTGRYLSPEPILRSGPEVFASRASVGGLTSAYSYASNNPIAFSDPDGLQPQGPKKYPCVPHEATQGKPRNEYKEALKVSKEGEKGTKDLISRVKNLYERVCRALRGDEPQVTPPEPEQPEPGNVCPERLPVPTPTVY